MWNSQSQKRLHTRLHDLESNFSSVVGVWVVAIFPPMKLKGVAKYKGKPLK
jgi:hypothetical protein